MLNNLGIIDRTLRIALGLVMLAAIFVGPKAAWGIFGLVPLATGLTAWCPLYSLFGLSTCRGGIRRES